jgi:hypothetical protein
VIDGTTVLSLRVITGLMCVWIEHVYCSEFVGRVVVAVTVEVSTFYDRKLLPVRICRAKRIQELKSFVSIVAVIMRIFIA